jgi:hypothetical protein
MMDPGTDAVQITFFPDFAATAKREESLTLAALAERIITTSAASKDGLPWLKLATFGDLRSGRNSLRCNANVLTVSGVEADYDQERVSVSDAVGILEEAGVLASSIHRHRTRPASPVGGFCVLFQSLCRLNSATSTWPD